jgi:hypothetical protein
MAGPGTAEDAKKPKNRLPPLADDERQLWVLCGNECAWGDCRERLMQPDGAWIGELAHIVGAEPGSARHEPTWTKDQLRAVGNLMFLCPNHHSRIDHTRSRDQYPVEDLRAMKEAHESRFRLALGHVHEQFQFHDVTRDAEPKYATTLAAMWQGPEEERDERIEQAHALADTLAGLTLAARQMLVMLANLPLDDKVPGPGVDRKRMGLAEIARRTPDLGADDILSLIVELDRNHLVYRDQDPLDDRDDLVLWSGATSALHGWPGFWEDAWFTLSRRPGATMDDLVVGLDFSLLD